jgi:hypothetical protein
MEAAMKAMTERKSRSSVAPKLAKTALVACKRQLGTAEVTVTGEREV